MRLTTENYPHQAKHYPNFWRASQGVFVFGSLVDDSEKGGDIDLLIETLEQINLIKKLQLMSLIQMIIGDRRIDLLVKNVSSKPKAIFETAKNEGILL